MKPRALTDEQAAYIREVIETRKKLPTHAKLAVEFGVSKRVIDELARGKTYKVPRETVTKLHDAMIEIGIETP